MARVAHHPLAVSGERRFAAACFARKEDATVTKYRVLNGINYPDGSGGENRAEIGAVVEDLPDKAAKWMLRDGIIETVGKVAKATAEVAEAEEEED